MFGFTEEIVSNSTQIIIINACRWRNVDTEEEVDEDADGEEE